MSKETPSTEQWLESRRVHIAPVDEAELIGVDHALVALRSLAGRVRDADRAFARSVLLAGKAGCGKTLAARFAAGLLGDDVPAYDLPPDTLTPRRVREAFALLAERPRSVVFFSEIDSVGLDRDSLGHDRASRRTLYALLEAIDGMVSVPADRGAIVIATTNRPRALDASLTRPGRLGSAIQFELPDATARRQMLALFLAGRAAGPMDAAYLAELMSGWSGAEIRGAVDEAWGLAFVRDEPAAVRVTEADLVLAIRRRGSIGRESEEEETGLTAQRTSIHEAGHAAVAIRLGLRVRSIRLGLGGRGGQTVTGDDDGGLDDAKLRASVVVAMAGVAAEQLVFGEGSLGGTRDVGSATRVLMDRIAGGLDPLFPPIDRRQFGDFSPRVVDEAIADHVMSLLDKAREEARLIVQQERDGIERLAATLITQSVLAGDALANAIAASGLGHPFGTHHSQEGSRGPTSPAPLVAAPEATPALPAR